MCGQGQDMQRSAGVHCLLSIKVRLKTCVNVCEGKGGEVCSDGRTRTEQKRNKENSRDKDDTRRRKKRQEKEEKRRGKKIRGEKRGKIEAEEKKRKERGKKRKKTYRHNWHTQRDSPT